MGCGLCENAIYLAAQNEVKEVTAVDFSPEALRQAEERIAAAKLPNPSKLRTLVADVLNLRAAFGEEIFDTVLDSAMLHCFNPADQRRYIESLTPHVSCISPLQSELYALREGSSAGMKSVDVYPAQASPLPTPQIGHLDHMLCSNRTSEGAPIRPPFNPLPKLRFLFRL